MGYKQKLGLKYERIYSIINIEKTIRNLTIQNLNKKEKSKKNSKLILTLDLLLNKLILKKLNL